MKKTVILLILTISLVGINSLQVQAKADSFAIYFQRAITKLYAYAADSTKTGVSFADGTLQKAFSRISVDNQIGSYSADWEHGTKRWIWTSVLLRKPKDQQSAAAIVQFKNKVDSLLTLVPRSARESSKNRVEVAYVSENVSDAGHRGYFQNDEVYLNIVFVKPLTVSNSVTDKIDSIISVYKPGMMSLATAGDAAKQLGETLDKNQIEQALALPKVAALVRKAADIDIRTAFEIITKINWRRDIKELATGLSPEQKEKVRELAQQVVDAYKEGRDFDVRTYTPAPPQTVHTPVYTTGVNANTSATTSTPMRRCNACDGTGEYDKPDYYHSYDGIFAKYETVHTTRVVCPICHGTGRVPDTKKR
jgi:hypothetical protein